MSAIAAALNKLYVVGYDHPATNALVATARAELAAKDRQAELDRKTLEAGDALADSYGDVIATLRAHAGNTAGQVLRKILTPSRQFDALAAYRAARGAKS